MPHTDQGMGSIPGTKGTILQKEVEPGLVLVEILSRYLRESPDLHQDFLLRICLSSGALHVSNMGIRAPNALRSLRNKLLTRYDFEFGVILCKS